MLKLRLPRMVEALAVGAALGVAGALLQGALANPLASPDVIGVTGGAGFGALLILLVFPGSIALLPVGALFFGLLAAALVFTVAWTGPNGGSIGRLILAGIAMGSLFAAGTSGLMSAYPDRVPSAIFFLAGGLTTSGWNQLESIWPYFAVGFVIAVCLIRPLDRLALGDEVAASLGTRPRLIRLGAGISAALLAAASAAIAGLLGFLGLVIPHTVRLAGGTASHGYVVPVSALGGATLLVTRRHARAHHPRADRDARRTADGRDRRAPVPLAAAQGGVMADGTSATTARRWRRATCASRSAAPRSSRRPT